MIVFLESWLEREQQDDELFPSCGNWRETKSTPSPAFLSLLSAHVSMGWAQGTGSEREADACFPWSHPSRKEGGKKGKPESYYPKAVLSSLSLLHFDALHSPSLIFACWAHLFKIKIPSQKWFSAIEVVKGPALLPDASRKFLPGRR